MLKCFPISFSQKVYLYSLNTVRIHTKGIYIQKSFVILANGSLLRTTSDPPNILNYTPKPDFCYVLPVRNSSSRSYLPFISIFYPDLYSKRIHFVDFSYSIISAIFLYSKSNVHTLPNTSYSDILCTASSQLSFFRFRFKIYINSILNSYC